MRLAIQSELHWLSETESLTLELDGAKVVGPLVRRARRRASQPEVRQCAGVLDTFQTTRSLGERWAEDMPNLNALVVNSRVHQVGIPDP